MTSQVYEPLSETAPQVSRKRELMAITALLVSIFSFVLQTEVLGSAAAQGYQKPMFVMYITHSCMMLLLPLQFLCLWVAKRITRPESFKTFYNKHRAHLHHTATQVARVNGHAAPDTTRYFQKAAIVLGIAVNLAGASWYIAVNMTTTADLTAIFNCSSFFAYGLSVLILNEKFSLAKAGSVLLSVVGVFIIAYLGSSADKAVETPRKNRRSLGNIIIAFGTILYGLYEVLYKKIACPPQTVSARRQAAFANLTGASIGLSTFLLMWPLLIVLHFTGVETFEVPSLSMMGTLSLSILGNVLFSGSFLILMSLTSPVMGSVSSLLATCVVPIIDFLIWHKKINLAELCGGLLILAAFGIMAWASRDNFVESDDSDTES